MPLVVEATTGGSIALHHRGMPKNVQMARRTSSLTAIMSGQGSCMNDIHFMNSPLPWRLLTGK